MRKTNGQTSEDENYRTLIQNMLLDLHKLCSVKRRVCIVQLK